MNVTFKEKGVNQTNIANNSLGDSNVTSVEDEKLNQLNIVNEKSTEGTNRTLEGKGVFNKSTIKCIKICNFINWAY